MLRFARLGAGLLGGLCIGLYILGLSRWPGYIAQHPDSVLPFNWTLAEMNDLLQRVGLSLQSWILMGLFLSLFSAFSYCLVGILIFVRRGRDWFGLYLAVVLVGFGTITSSQVSILTNFYGWLEPLLQASSVMTWAAWFLVFYLFPDGKFTPSWASGFAALMMVSFGVDILVNQGKTPPPWLGWMLLLSIVMAMYSLVYRWRKSGPVQRQQIKWVLFSILILIISLVVGLLSALYPELTRSDKPFTFMYVMFIQMSSLLMISFPLSIGFAMLRYRLWDVDLIIRRTLVYTILSAMLGLVYFGGVTLLQNLFAVLSGQQSPAALVISTLLIAALVNPLRRRIQEFIDRRFYRQKYNAELALAAFASAARSETELARLSNRLTTTVQEALLPEQVSLWFNPGNSPDRKEGSDGSKN